LKKARQVDFLLVVAAQRGPLLLADDREHRLMIRLGVVQAVEQMDRAGAGSRHADADVATELCVRGGHESREFYVARPREPHFFAHAVHRAHQAVDAVAGITVDATHAPRDNLATR